MKITTSRLDNVEKGTLVTVLGHYVAVVLLLENVKRFDDVDVSKTRHCSFFIG